VTRTVDSNKQLAWLDGARINRDAGQPGHGRNALRERDTQSFSDLASTPPQWSISVKLSVTRTLDFKSARLQNLIDGPTFDLSAYCFEYPLRRKILRETSRSSKCSVPPRVI
jgi:hypothetical protein